MWYLRPGAGGVGDYYGGGGGGVVIDGNEPGDGSGGDGQGYGGGGDNAPGKPGTVLLSYK